MATRRAFIASLLAAGACPALSWADAGSPAYLAAAKVGDRFPLHGLDEGGDSLFAIDLPGRGHAACAHPTRPEAVAFARRPGTFALVLNCATGATAAQLTPPEGRQFNGHGAYLQEGALLCTSEVVTDGSAGRIGLWDATRGYARIGEWDSGGIGPHEIRALPDGRLVVANGGIITDPTDRTKLNIADMRPNLTLLDAYGHQSDQAELPPDLHQCSIRHLALTGDGTIAFAMQWEGDAALTVPLLGLWRPGLAPRLAEVEEDLLPGMKGYAGSIAVSRDGSAIALTSPKGGMALIYGPDGKPLAAARRPDICGAAPGPGDSLLLTDGLGGVSRWSASEGLTQLAHHDLGWDNHLVALI